MGNETQRVRSYRIPPNFIDESRLLNGMVRTRFFLEGCVMALVAAVPAFLIPVSERTHRISIIVILCGIPLLLGVVGINGDPISVVLHNMVDWRKARGVMLYNMETVALKTSPLTAAMREKRASDTLIDMVETYRENKKAKLESEVFVEGVTFRFAEDPHLKKLYAQQIAPEYEPVSDWIEEPVWLQEAALIAEEAISEDVEIDISAENDEDGGFF